MWPADGGAFACLGIDIIDGDLDTCFLEATDDALHAGDAIGASLIHRIDESFVFGIKEKSEHMHA